MVVEAFSIGNDLIPEKDDLFQYLRGSIQRHRALSVLFPFRSQRGNREYVIGRKRVKISVHRGEMIELPTDTRRRSVVSRLGSSLRETDDFNKNIGNERVYLGGQSRIFANSSFQLAPLQNTPLDELISLDFRKFLALHFQVNLFLNTACHVADSAR